MQGGVEWHELGTGHYGLGTTVSKVTAKGRSD